MGCVRHKEPSRSGTFGREERRPRHTRHFFSLLHAHMMVVCAGLQALLCCLWARLLRYETGGCVRGCRGTSRSWPELVYVAWHVVPSLVLVWHHVCLKAWAIAWVFLLRQMAGRGCVDGLGTPLVYMSPIVAGVLWCCPCLRSCPKKSSSGGQVVALPQELVWLLPPPGTCAVGSVL